MWMVDLLLTRSDVGVGGVGDVASVETDWLEVEEAGSDAAGETGCVDEELVASGVLGSAFSSSFTTGETLKKTK